MTLAVELLRVTNKAIGHCPFLLLQPLGTCAVLLLLWALWAAVLLSLGTAGEVGAAAPGPPPCWWDGVWAPRPRQPECRLRVTELRLGPGKRDVLPSLGLKSRWFCFARERAGELEEDGGSR